MRPVFYLDPHPFRVTPNDAIGTERSDSSPSPGQLILEPAPSHDGSSIHPASRVDLCAHICVTIHTSSILPLCCLSCCWPDLTLPCMHVEEQQCLSQRCSSLTTAVKQNSLRQDKLQYQAESQTMQLRCVGFLIYSFACPSSERKTNSNQEGSLFQLQLHSFEAVLPLSDDGLLAFSLTKNDKNVFLPLIITLLCFCLPSVWTAC